MGVSEGGRGSARGLSESHVTSHSQPSPGLVTPRERMPGICSSARMIRSCCHQCEASHTQPRRLQHTPCRGVFNPIPIDRSTCNHTHTLYTNAHRHRHTRRLCGRLTCAVTILSFRTGFPSDMLPKILSPTTTPSPDPPSIHRDQGCIVPHCAY